MLVILSPAKRLDFESEPRHGEFSQPELLDQAEVLVERARKLSAGQIRALMGVSEKLAEQTRARFQAFAPPFDLANARQAIFAFRGDTYLGLEAETLRKGDLAFAQDHLRILSGLYGVLRPLDLIQPYRLEMGAKLSTRRGRDLYAFWGSRITKALGRALEGEGEPVLVNCASKEYSRAIEPGLLPARIVTPVFKEIKGGTPRVLGMFAKQARGMMARYIIKDRIETVEALLKFRAAGYRYAPEHSEPDRPVFTRPQPAPKR